MLTEFAFANFEMAPESIKYFEAAFRINPKNRASKFYLERLSQPDGLRKGSGSLVKEESLF